MNLFLSARMFQSARARARARFYDSRLNQHSARSFGVAAIFMCRCLFLMRAHRCGGFDRSEDRRDSNNETVFIS